MKWNVDEPYYGQRRKITRFLWWPKTIRGEARWLVIATYVQVYRLVWEDVGWIEYLDPLDTYIPE